MAQISIYDSPLRAGALVLCDTNGGIHINASWQALVDSIEYKLLRDRDACMAIKWARGHAAPGRKA